MLNRLLRGDACLLLTFLFCEGGCFGCFGFFPRSSFGTFGVVFQCGALGQFRLCSKTVLFIFSKFKNKLLMGHLGESFEIRFLK